MGQKVSISFCIPVRFKLIANGERVIEQTGPDEIDVDVREGKLKGESWLHELSRLFDEAEREMRKSKRRRGHPSSAVQIPTTSNGGGQKTTAKGTGAVE